jgi:hypothetical protein
VLCITTQIALDFDADYGYTVGGSSSLEANLFGDLIGCDAVAKVVERFRSTLCMMKEKGLNQSTSNLFSLTFQFTGNPGKVT